jgi:hypothetical protein
MGLAFKIFLPGVGSELTAGVTLGEFFAATETGEERLIVRRPRKNSRSS